MTYIRVKQLIEQKKTMSLKEAIEHVNRIRSYFSLRFIDLGHKPVPSNVKEVFELFFSFCKTLTHWETVLQHTCSIYCGMNKSVKLYNMVSTLQ